MIGILFADKYAGIEIPLIILMLSVCYMAASGVFYQLLLAEGHERSLFIVVIIVTVLQVAANFLLIPRLGITGAALGMLLLVVLTSIGLSVVVWTRGLFSGQAIPRIFSFLTIFMGLTCLVIYFALSVWFALLICVAGLAFSAWWLLFEGFERKILQEKMKALLA